MKLSIRKELKILLISIIVILVGIISFLLYKEVKNPDFEEQKITLYNYINKGIINYRIVLKPNILYEDDTLDEGQLYLSELINYIKTSFIYEFTGDRKAEIEGYYDIIVKVQGFTGGGEDLKNIWEKDFVISPKKNFISKDKTKLIKEDIELKLDEYNSFAREVIKISKINCQTKLSIIMNINIKGITDKGTIEDVISPTMVIPLNTSMFNVGGNLNIEKPGSIEQAKLVQLPVDKNKVITCGISLGVLSIILIFIVFFTKSHVITDPLEKKLKKIFKNHGDRLVALNSEVAVPCDNYSSVKSIEDLVRIADEIGKPIMYKHSLDFKEMSKFYVYDENQMYIWDLTKILLESDLNNSKKEKEKSTEDVKKLRKVITGLKASKQQEEESETETTESKS